MVPVTDGGKNIYDRNLGFQGLVGLLRLLLRLRLSAGACFSQRARGNHARQSKSENACRIAGHPHCIIPLENIADRYDASGAPLDVRAKFPSLVKTMFAATLSQSKKRENLMNR